MKNFFFKGSYFVISFIFCIGTLEIFSRIVRPTFPGARKINEFGEILEGLDFNHPGSNYFQYSSEYKAITNIDEKGNRKTPTSNENVLEKVIFLGDSQTFGQGLSDEETISSNFCKLSNKKINCINLGQPGGNTFSQLYKLKNLAADIDLKDATVFNLLHGSTVNAFSGNDISECLSAQDSYHEVSNKISNRKDYFLKIGRHISRRSNLFRLIRLNIPSTSRSIGYMVSPNTVFDKDIECFARTANEIKSFTKFIEAKYIPILISPSAEISMGLIESSLETIKQAFDKDILTPQNISEQDFYAIDGHYNPEGAEKVAEFLLSIYSLKN